MAEAKSKTLLVLNRNYVLTTTKGHSVAFEKGKPTHVPPAIYQEALAIGAIPPDGADPLVEEVIKTDPRFKITRSQTGDFTRAKGKEVMEAFLKTDPNIQVLYAHNDDMAIGAIQAIEAAGLKPGKDIVIVSIDAVKGAFEAMMAGKLNVSVECNPLLGPQLMEVVKEVKAGKELPKRINTKEGVFPMETAAKEFPNRKY